MSRVGEKIKEARLKAGMTQKALAKKLGVAEKYINEVESGRKVAQESFIDRAAKILKTDLNDISMIVTDEALMEERKSESVSKKPAKIEVNEVWNDAFASVLRSVPVYGYALNTVKGKREMPVHSNKIEGYPQDKVLFIEIEDTEMSGFRMMPGDVAFAHLVKETSNNGIFLVEYKGKRKIRQIKNLGNSKILLVSNGGTIMTETAEVKEVDILAKLERVEIKL